MAKTTHANEKLTLTVSEMAAMLSIGRTLAYELIHREDFPVVWLGSRAVIPKEGLQKWLEKNSAAS